MLMHIFYGRVMRRVYRQWRIQCPIPYSNSKNMVADLILHPHLIGTLLHQTFILFSEFKVNAYAPVSAGTDGTFG